MAETTNRYSWPPMDKRRVMGKPIKRVDGPAKAAGRAKYNSDIKPPGMLWADIHTSPYAHARVVAVDTSAAEKAPGVQAVYVISGPGTEVQWEGTEIAAVAATTEEQAHDAASVCSLSDAQ